MTCPRRAIVVGGSMGGLFAAHLLLRHGWEVDVYERTTGVLAGRGAGIVTHRRLDAALAATGVALRSEDGVAIPERRLYDRDGGLLRRLPFPQVNTSWDRLWQVLHKALPAPRYHAGRNVIALNQGNGGVEAIFADGARANGDMLIAADGLRSTVRDLLMPQVQPRYAGYVAWRGLVDEAALSSATRDALMSCFAFALAPGEQMLGYPVAGEGDGARQRYNFVWYRPADVGTTLPRLLTDVNGTRHALAVPPPLIDPRVIEEMRTDAHRLLPPCFGEVVALTPLPFLQPVFDLEVPSMVAGRVALIGDAAFVARPHVGGGVTKAAEDAVALAEYTSDANLDLGLARFDVARGAAGRILVARGRALGGNRDRAEAESTGGLDVLRDTASLAFLDETGAA